MTDLMASGPNIPSEELLAQQVSALTDQITGHNADLSKAPPGMDNWTLQTWNVGQLTNELPNKPTVDQINQRARTMYTNFDQLTSHQQQIALEMANVQLFAEFNRNRLKGDVLTPGTAQQPNIVLDAQARGMYGADAWMLNIPEVRMVLEQGAQQGWDQATLEAKIRSTQWWASTSQAQQEFLNLQATSPAELNFNTAGSRAQTVLTQVTNDAAKAGYSLSQADLHDLAMKALEFGWNDQLILQEVAAKTQYWPGEGTNNAPAIANQVKQQAADYFQKLPDSTIGWWSGEITRGAQTADTLKAWLADQAKQKWVGMANQIDQGLTPQQITAGLRSDAAQTMEIDPTQIDFLNDPTYQKMLDYVPPGETNHRLMTISEANTYLKSQPKWGYTQQARDQVGTQTNSILKTFGVIA